MYFNQLFKTDDCVVTQIPDLTPDEIAAAKAIQQAERDLAQKKIPILAQLNSIDLQSIRALRTNDTAKIADWESKASVLRTQLASIK